MSYLKLLDFLAQQEKVLSTFPEVGGKPTFLFGCAAAFLMLDPVLTSTMTGLSASPGKLATAWSSGSSVCLVV